MFASFVFVTELYILVPIKHSGNEIIIARQAKCGPSAESSPSGVDTVIPNSLHTSGGNAVIKPPSIPTHAPARFSFFQKRLSI